MTRPACLSPLMSPRSSAVFAAFVFSTGVLACGPAPATVPPKDPPPTSDLALGREQDPEQMLADRSASFLDGYSARNPVAATAYGEHRYDERWPDLSADGRAEHSRWIDDQLDGLTDIPRAALDADGRLELDTIRNQLELARFAIEVEDLWHSDPLGYTYLISAGLDDLVSRDFAPLETRAQSVAARLEGLPEFIAQILANLADPAALRRPQTEVALAQLAGLETLISVELPERTAEASEAERKRIAVAIPEALAAVDSLAAHLEAAIPKAEGTWRLGSKPFATKLALTLQTELSADELLRLAYSEHARVSDEMYFLAEELDAGMNIKTRKRAAAHGAGANPSERASMIREVLSELAADHPRPEQLRAAAEANLSRLDAFVRAQALVPTDDAEVLEVIWTPPHAQGVAIAGLAAPAPLDADKPGLPSFYLVQPLPKTWDEFTRDSFLREYNTFMLEILSIHEAIPGHFVQLYWGKREPSKVRRVFQNGPFVEGWAVYTERLMVEAGYAGAGPEPGAKRPRGLSKALWAVQTDDALRAKAIRLHGLKFYLRTVTNAILDHEIHAGDMGRDEAVEFMVERSFQERGEAEGKWTRAQITSTQLSTYFVGATAWFRLRAQAEAMPDFDLMRFHEAALGHGAPPVHRLPELMGWEAAQ